MLWHYILFCASLYPELIFEICLSIRLTVGFIPPLMYTVICICTCSLHWCTCNLHFPMPNDTEKAAEPEIKLPTSTGSLKKQASSRKTSISALLTMPKPLTMWITTNCGKFFKRQESQTTLPASWEICMQVRKQQLELDMEKQTSSRLGKEYKAVNCHPAYLTYM